MLGGGQLGRMLGLAGIPLGTHVPVPRSVGGSSGRSRRRARRRRRSTTSAAATTAAAGATVVTYEWEGVPADTARALADDVAVRPSARALEVSQDRVVEKETFRALGDRDGAVPRRRRSGRARRRDFRLGASRGAQDAARRLRRQGPGHAPLRRRCRHRVGRARRRSAHPRGLRAVRARAVDRRGARARRRDSRVGRSWRTRTSAASCA